MIGVFRVLVWLSGSYFMWSNDGSCGPCGPHLTSCGPTMIDIRLCRSEINGIIINIICILKKFKNCRYEICYLTECDGQVGYLLTTVFELLHDANDIVYCVIVMSS